MLKLESLNHRHQALLSWLLSNPHRKVQDAGAELGYSRPYISAVFHSDAFQAAYQQACKENGIEASHIGASIKEKLGALAHTSLEEIQRRLDANVLESKEVLSAGKLALTALGYINPKGYSVEIGSQTNIQVDITVIDAARERALRTPPPPSITIPATIEAA